MSAESVAVDRGDLLTVLLYMQTDPNLPEHVLNALDRLGDTALKARMAQQFDGDIRTTASFDGVCEKHHNDGVEP